MNPKILQRQFEIELYGKLTIGQICKERFPFLEQSDRIAIGNICKDELPKKSRKKVKVPGKNYMATLYVGSEVWQVEQIIIRYIEDSNCEYGQGVPLWSLSQTTLRDYDCVFGFVIAARDEKSARKMAGVECGDEGMFAWTDDTKSSCKQLAPSSTKPYPTIVCRDFNAG